MAFKVQRVDYFYAVMDDQLGEGHRLLSQLLELGINLLAFTAVPQGPARVQLTIFPADPAKLVAIAKNAGLALDGPHPALLIQGDDELGALAGIHAKLHQAKVNVYASSGVTDGRGSFGYVVYVKPEDITRAVGALKT
jgi:hypothetical protein